MSGIKWAIIVAVGCSAAAFPALAQPSLFSQPSPPPPTLTQPGAPATAAAPKPRAKPRGPVPARALSVVNDSTGTVVALEVTGDGKTAKLAQPLGPRSRTTLRLPVLKTCLVTVTTTFEGTDGDTTSQDVCKDKSIRFTE